MGLAGHKLLGLIINYIYRSIYRDNGHMAALSKSHVSSFAYG